MWRLLDLSCCAIQNMLVAVDYFFQTNAYCPFATCGNDKCGKIGPTPMSLEKWFSMEPTKSRSTRHLTKDRSFLDKASIFDFRTMAAFETIREPVNTFRKFEGFINRMPSHKSPERIGRTGCGFFIGYLQQPVHRNTGGNRKHSTHALDTGTVQGSLLPRPLRPLL